MNEIDEILLGNVRPPNNPDDWEGQPIPGDKGWRWFNPKNRGDSVRIYVADEPYVVVTKNCQVIGRDGALTGECLED